MRGLPLQAVYPGGLGLQDRHRRGPARGRRQARRGRSASTAASAGSNEKLLEDDPRRDRRCLTLAAGDGPTAPTWSSPSSRSATSTPRSCAAGPSGSASTARSPSPSRSTPRSPGSPSEGFGLANTAAGFGEVFLSPLHAALLGAAVGNKGADAASGALRGRAALVEEGDEPRSRRDINDMCELTVTEGTARRAFRERGRYALGRIQAAGKTGSLADKKPFRDFSWFVGGPPRTIRRSPWPRWWSTG